MTEPNRLLLREERGKRQLVFIPSSTTVSGRSLASLGFSPIALPDGTAAWQRGFHPTILRQIQNLLGDEKLSASPELLSAYGEHLLDNQIEIDPYVLARDETLKLYQIDAVKFLGTRARAFLGLAPGLGKTLSALRAAEAAGYRHICVVAPLSLLGNWRREIERWLPDTRVLLLRSGEAEVTGPKTAQRLIVLCSYESFQKHNPMGKPKKPELLIFDETVLLKNRNTKRVNSIFNVTKNYNGSIWMLSGGPTAKFLDDFWSQLHILDPKRFSSYWQFAHHYCLVEETQWGMRILANQSGGQELLSKDIADIYFARTQDQVENLPPFIFEDIDVEMDEEQAKIYKQMETEFLAALPSGDEVVATNTLTQLLRLSQIASNSLLLEDEGTIPTYSPKWEYVADLMKFVEKPVIVWTNFIRTANLLGTRLGKLRTETLTGQAEPAKRQEIVERLQHGEVDVLIAHPAVGKFGHTLTAARTAIYVERSYNGDDYYQSLYRIRRIGTTTSPQIVHLLSTCAGTRTVDHAIGAILKYRHDNNVSLITSRTLRQAWKGDLE